MGCGESKVTDQYRKPVILIVGYQDPDLWQPSGKYKTLNVHETPQIFHDAAHFLCAAHKDTRLNICGGQLKYKELTVHKIKDMYPHWSDEMLSNIRLQFRAFDTNEDNLIDIIELSSAFPKIQEDQLENYFNEVDTDGSEAIDFEGFLQLMDILLHCDDSTSAFLETLQAGSHNISQLYQLSIVEQIQNGIL